MSLSISVVIPVRNRPRGIAAALDSVMAQTLLPIEVIVIDDASTDGTVSSVQSRTADPLPVQIIPLPVQRGGAHARNVGIDVARGHWVALLDSDDVWSPDKLERQAALLAGAPTDCVCFTNLLVDHHDGQPADRWNTLPFADGGDVERFMLGRQQVVQTSTLLLPAARARAVRFDERLQRHQDMDFTLRLYRRGVPFRYVDEPLVLYSADPAAERVSRRVGAAPSLAWLDVARDYADRAALSGFYAREVFGLHYQDASAAALHRLGTSVGQGHVSPRLAARILSREVVPGKVKRGIRSLVARSSLRTRP